MYLETMPKTRLAFTVTWSMQTHWLYLLIFTFWSLIFTSTLVEYVVLAYFVNRMLSPQDRRHLTELLLPSWLSGLIAVAGGLFIAGGVIAAFSFHSSSIQQQLVGWQANK